MAWPRPSGCKIPLINTADSYARAIKNAAEEIAAKKPAKKAETKPAKKANKSA